MPDKDKTNLQGAFGDKGKKSTQIDYTHPHAAEILESIYNVMKNCETGYSLWHGVKDHGFPFRVLKGKAEPGFSPEAKVVYIYVPAKQTEAKVKQVLDLAKGLRMAEQDLVGFTAPDPSKDMLTYASVVHAKNLDSIVFMCKVVSELRETSYYQNLLDELTALGHGNVYNAYVSQVSKEDLAETYLVDEGG